MSPLATPLLDRVNHPVDLRNFSVEQLKQLADELRAETIDAVCRFPDESVTSHPAPSVHVALQPMPSVSVSKIEHAVDPASRITLTVWLPAPLLKNEIDLMP